MKKVMMAVGVAACVTLVGCKHNEYGAHKVGNKVEPVETVEVASDVDPVTLAGADGKAAASTAPAGKSNTAVSSVGSAGAAGAMDPAGTMAVPTKDDGKAVTTVTSVPDAPAKDGAGTKAAVHKVEIDDGAGSKAAAGAGAAAGAAAKAADGKTAKDAAEPEFTPYVVRGGDTLGGICYRYKVKKADVLKLNPGMDPNKIFVGRTIKLPGNIEAAKAASAAKADAKHTVKEPTGKREYKPYTGETKEYVVVAGDTIGGIAYSNGLSIRQFKELNGLKSDLIRVGQKVKIPLTKVKADKPVAVPAKKAEAKAEKAGPKVIEEKKDEIKPVADEAKAAAKEVEAKAEEKVEKTVDEAASAVVPAAPAAEGDYITYTVKPNDDLYSVAIKWSITASQLKEINNLTDDTLTPGQVLKVPAAVD